jgi:hypothetical protein
MIGIELLFVFGLFGEGIQVGRVLGTVYILGELVDPIQGVMLCLDVGALALDVVAQVEDVVKQGAAERENEEVGEHDLPTRPASAGVFVLTFLRHDGAKVKLFFKVGRAIGQV